MQHPINIKIPVTNTFMEIPFKWTAGQMFVKKFSNLSGCPNDENRGILIFVRNASINEIIRIFIVKQIIFTLR